MTTTCSGGERGADSGSSSGVADSGSGETGTLPTCTDLPDEPACRTESQCKWVWEWSICNRDCEMITDLAVCMMSAGCIVYGDTCGLIR